MPAQTYVIRDGVRRAKAAWLLGHEDVWAWVDGESGERKIPLGVLRSTKGEIDVGEKEGARWRNVFDGMTLDPDLFEPIKVSPEGDGIPIGDVALRGG